MVDAVYGNDASAQVGISPFKTISAAINAITTGQTVWVLPGTYTLTSGITMPPNSSMRGLSLQTVKLELDASGTNTTLLTMGENTRVEDLTLTLTSSSAVNLTGISFPGTTSQTSKIRTCVVNVNNASVASSTATNVYGANFIGTGSLNTSTFSFNSIKGSTINVYSNGIGTKRGILVSNTNQVSTRDVNIFVAAPTDVSGSTGSYVGVETNDASGIGSIQMRSTTVGVVYPVTGNGYTASDIRQTTPSTILSPTYLASAGIQIGPGTDLVTKSAGGMGFSTYIYTNTLYYGLKGSIAGTGNNSPDNSGYLWPGTQRIEKSVFPDTTLPPAYYRVQQPCLMSGISCGLNQAPGTGNSITFLVRYTPYGGTVTDTPFTVTLTDTQKIGSFYNASVQLNAGDLIHVQMIFAGASNIANDITVQVDLF